MHLTTCTSIEDVTSHGRLAAMAGYFGQVERTLYNDYKSGANKTKGFKPGFSQQHGLTSRQFNTLDLSVAGKIDGTREVIAFHVEQLEAKSRSLVKAIADLAHTIETGLDRRGRQITQARLDKQKLSIRAKRQALARRRSSITALQVRMTTEVPGICFGSRDLFGKQFHLRENGYASHDAWLADWRNARSSQFLVVGSADEPGGCNECQAHVEDDGSVTLRLRPYNHMLAAAGGVGKAANVLTRRKTITARANDFIVIRGLRLHNYAGRVIDILRSNEVATTPKARTPLTWRFLRKNDKWYVHLSLNIEGKAVFDGSNGAIGVDFNEDHIAATAADAHGNKITVRRFDLNLFGLTSNQAADRIGCVAKALVAWATELGLPLVAEELDFAKKKASMAGMSASRKRKLSSLHYKRWGQALQSRCLKDGVALKLVSPSFTSLIGRVKYASSLGLSIHHSAALVISRRGLGIAETMIDPSAVRVPDGKGRQVTIRPVAYMGRRHGGRLKWGDVYFAVNAALAAHFSDIRRCAADSSLANDDRFLRELVGGLEIGGAIPSRSPLFRLEDVRGSAAH